MRLSIKMITIFAALALFMTFGLIKGWDKQTDVANTHQAIQPDPTPQPKPSAISVGDTAHINTRIAIAVNEKAWDKLNEASRARDSIGMANLVANGQIFIAEPETKVLVLDRGFTSMKVRVMSGQNIGKSGWLVREAVSR